MAFFSDSNRRIAHFVGPLSSPLPDPISTNPAPCLTLTLAGKIQAASQGFWDHVGYKTDQPCEDGFSKLSMVFGTHDWGAILNDIKQNRQHQIETWASRPDGSAVRVQISIDMLPPVAGADPIFFLHASYRDALNDKHDVLLRKSLQDPLTGLFNRSHLETAASELIETARETETNLSVLVLDLNDFKKVNDTYGHHVGDMALKHIAKSLTLAVPLGELIARYGGDEFVMVLSDIRSESYILNLIEDIRNMVAKPFWVDGLQLEASVSVGFSVFPEHGHSLMDLMRWADASMYEQKRRRKHRTHARMAEHSPPRDAPRVNFEHVKPFYQPIVSLHDGRIRAVEALARGVGDAADVILPAEFLPSAESDGSIVDLDRRMFSHVCEDLSNQSDNALAGLNVSINLCAATLNHPDFFDYLLAKVEASKLQPHDFCIELTESVTLMENDPGRQSLFDLHDLGFAVALDDFGTGFSSLSILKDLPISRLKIDRCFIVNLTHSRREQRIVESVLNLCQSLDTTSVVEGVETKEQAQMLLDMGANYGQGFYFSPALPLEKLTISDPVLPLNTPLCSAR